MNIILGGSSFNQEKGFKGSLSRRKIFLTDEGVFLIGLGGLSDRNNHY